MNVEYAVYPINLGSIELCKINDAEDYIYKNASKWYKHEIIKKISSYNGETITTDYVSSTGGLDTGATIYYVGEASDIEISDSTLKSQLDALLIAECYYPQTQIKQSNSDLPFILKASLTYTPNANVENIGNINAKPILTIIGSGNISVSLNGIQILEIALGEGGTIVIDVPNLEAYNPNDQSLLNRLVTGDYMKLLINSGDNILQINGNVSEYTLTDYTRWI